MKVFQIFGTLIGLNALFILAIVWFYSPVPVPDFETTMALIIALMSLSFFSTLMVLFMGFLYFIIRYPEPNKKLY